MTPQIEQKINMWLKAKMLKYSLSDTKTQEFKDRLYASVFTQYHILSRFLDLTDETKLLFDQLTKKHFGYSVQQLNDLCISISAGERIKTSVWEVADKYRKLVEGIGI